MALIERPDRIFLQRHPFIATRSLDEMQWRLAEALEPRHMRVTRGRAVDVLTNQARVRDSTLFWNRYGAQVRVRSRVPLRTQHLLVPLAGAVCSRSGGCERVIAPGRALVNTAGVEVDVEWSADCAAIVVAVDGTAFRRFACRIGEPDLVSPHGETYCVDLNGGSGRSLGNVVEALLEECEAQESLIQDDAYGQRLEELLCIALLRSRPLAATSPPGRGRARPPFLVRATEFLAAHAGDDIGPGDVVAACGVSLRTLQEAFARHYGVGPMTWLRNLRLDRVRAELERAPPGAVKVGDVAGRWGFYHLSHFTAAYRRRFGELPSQTLRNRA